MRTTRAFSKGILRRNLICFATGGSGISSDTRDRNGKERRIARSAPPVLSLSRVQNSKNSLPCPLIPRTNTGMAREIRAHRRRSRSSVGEARRRLGMHNHTQIARCSNSRVTTNDNLGRGCHLDVFRLSMLHELWVSNFAFFGWKISAGWLDRILRPGVYLLLETGDTRSVRVAVGKPRGGRGFLSGEFQEGGLAGFLPPADGRREV
jgi:hypothetical protein